MTSLHCPECQVENPIENRACHNCGKPFKGEPTTVLGTPATAPAVAVAPAQSLEDDAYSNLLPSDAVLQDRYRITQLLGQGGMGAVYLATDTRFASRTCVIKEMLDHFNDPEQRAQATESFHREADFLATLKHPGIPEVYDRFTESNRHYLVMEYINGTDLEARLLEKGTPFEENEVIGWMIQCLDVLSYLHHQKPPIIYRDMKPANVITTEWGKVSLVDFGIARFFNPVSRGTMIGTQGYAPPEQYRGQVEPRSDIYALGATMHYMLTGRDPQNEPPFSFPPVKTLNPDISDEIEMLILKALDPDVENRFASADEMLGELMAIGGAQTDVVRECPHCGKLSTITRQFCPHCKQYISKKAHVLRKDASGALVTDAAGLHVNRPNSPTERFEGNKAATATTLAVPTGRTEVNFFSLRPVFYGLGAGAVLLAAAVFGARTFFSGHASIVSQGAAILTTRNADKSAGARAYANHDYQTAIADFNRAVAADPHDGEARIYLQNSYLMLAKVPTAEVAIAGPFSGQYASKGEAELQGAAFAQERINGSDHTPRLLLELADDRSGTNGAIAVSKTLGDDQDVVGVVGHLDSDASWAAMPLYNLTGLPVISPTSTSTQLSGLSPNFFRLSPDDALEGAALANYVTERMNAQTIAVLTPENAPTRQGLASAFVNQAEAAGAMVRRVPYNAQSDWAQIVNSLKSSAPQAIFLAGSHLDAIALAKAKASAGLNTPLVGGDALYLPDLLKDGGSAVEGIICGCYYHPQVDTPQARRFETDFEGKFGAPANSRAALTDEAVELFAKAAQNVGPSRTAISRYLKTLGQDGFDSLTGHARVDAQGNVRRPLYLMQVQGGRFRPLTQVVL
ncbi:MAG TPA: ABC transporter substrate-binding protein [Oscillatoriaceae cyanobacterium]